MQINRLYPTAGTTNYDFDLTAPFMSLPEDFKTDMGDQYLMGYCDAEHMPACCTPVYFNQTTDELSFLADYSQNYGFGFARWTYDGGAAPGNLYYIDGEDNIVRSWGVDYDFQFINRGEMCRVNTNPAVEIFVEAIYIRSDLYDGVKCTRLLNGGTEAGTINNLGGVWLAFTFNDFVDMIKNDTPIINGTYTGGGDASGLSFNITVRPSDFGNGFDPNSPHYVTWDAGNGFYVFFAIEGVRMGGNTPVYHNGTSIPQNIVPFFSVPHNSEKKSIIVPGSYIQSAVRFRYENGSFTAIQNGGSFGYNQATEFVNNVVYGGFNNGVLSVNDIDWSEATLSGQRRNVFFVRNFYGIFLGAGEFRFYSLYTPRDIYNYLCLYHKHTSVPSDSYSADDTVTVFTEQDSPTFDTVSGTLSDIISQLRPWQIPGVDITANEFTPEDIPEPEPGPEPGPTPQETESKFSGFPTLGPSTRIIPTSGVNFYALNPSLVTDFIQRLWSQPKNFYEAIQIAGNQVDSIFDYIQSFRYYPLKFDFSTENVYPVIFGTGAVLKEADGDTNFQLSQVYPIQYTVAAGQWDLSDPIYHWRNNFLDYSPYLKMSIYLPFAGTIELSPEAVASHSDITTAIITLLVSFDIETGTITYYVANQASVLLAQKTVKIAIDLPLSGNNSAEQSAAILRAQFSTVKQLLGAGTSAVMGAATGNMAGVASAAVSTLGSVGDMYLQNSLAQRAVPVEIQGMGGTFSALAGGQYPYITINRQKVSNPPNYAHTTGYLVEGTYKISNLNGLTVCRNVDVSGIGQATDKEKAQIKQILESGFYA